MCWKVGSILYLLTVTLYSVKHLYPVNVLLKKHSSFYTQDDDLLAIHRNFREVVMTYYTILFEPLIH